MFDAKLGNALNFTEDDLQQNRDGKLSSRQVFRVRRKAIGYGVFALVVSMVAIIIGILILQDENTNDPIGIVIAFGVAIVFPLILIPIIRRLWNAGGDGQIQMLEGKITSVTERKERMENVEQITRTVHIGGQRFSINRKVYQALKDKKGQHYRVYYLDEDNIRSMEPTAVE